MCCSSGIRACLRCWPSVATAAAMATTPSSRVTWCWRRGRSPSSLSLRLRRGCTRAGSSWWAQLDVQISLQQSSLSGGGQGCLSTSSPHSTEGVEDAEELPMVGVNHLLVKKTGSLTAHILKQESELEKGLKRCKSCDWSLLLFFVEPIFKFCIFHLCVSKQIELKSHVDTRVLYMRITCCKWSS